MSLRFGLVVPGRFHAFDLARALLAAGHEVDLFTNYPAWAVARFGVPGRHVRSFWPHGVASRVLGRLAGWSGRPAPEAALLRSFGRWAERALSRSRCDVVLAFSGVAEELLRSRRLAGLKVLVRGSCHIREQARLLEEEETRAGVAIDRPSPWIVEREEREYALADRVCVLSSFAEATFRAAGVPAERLWRVPLAIPVERFRATHAALRARTERLDQPGPLRVLTVGRLCHQKGVLDLIEAARLLAPSEASFRAVGTIQPEARAVLQTATRIEHVPHVPQAALTDHFAWADVLLIPTIQDGFAQVLAEGLAAGVPFITTPNSGGPDLLAIDARYGWLVPIRAPAAIAAQLRACQSARGDLARRASSIAEATPRWTWRDVAADLERRVQAVLAAAPC